MINDWEQKVQGFTEKVDRLSSLVNRQEQYSRRICILLHSLKENQNKDTDNVVIYMISTEMDLLISLGDIDLTHRKGVPNGGKSRPRSIKFAQYNDMRSIFTNKKRLKRKDLSVTESLTVIRMRELTLSWPRYLSYKI